jgi:hypothetical protein
MRIQCHKSGFPIRLLGRALPFLCCSTIQEIAARSPGRGPAAIRSQFGYSGLVQPLALQMGTGSPSAILGSAEVARNRVIAAKASMSRFKVLLLCERGAPCTIARRFLLFN